MYTQFDASRRGKKTMNLNSLNKNPYQRWRVPSWGGERNDCGAIPNLRYEKGESWRYNATVLDGTGKHGVAVAGLLSSVRVVSLHGLGNVFGVKFLSSDAIRGSWFTVQQGRH